KGTLTMKRFLPLSLALALLPCAFSGCSEPAETIAEPTPSPSPAAASASPAAKTISAPQPRSFTVDRALLPADAEDYLGDARGDYDALLDAVCAGETEVALQDAD